jgi:hypothetical protein
LQQRCGGLHFGVMAIWATRGDFDAELRKSYSDVGLLGWAIERHWARFFGKSKS